MLFLRNKKKHRFFVAACVRKTKYVLYARQGMPCLYRRHCSLFTKKLFTI